MSRYPPEADEAQRGAANRYSQYSFTPPPPPPPPIGYGQNNPYPQPSATPNPYPPINHPPPSSTPNPYDQYHPPHDDPFRNPADSHPSLYPPSQHSPPPGNVYAINVGSAPPSIDYSGSAPAPADYMNPYMVQNRPGPPPSTDYLNPYGSPGRDSGVSYPPVANPYPDDDIDEHGDEPLLNRRGSNPSIRSMMPGGFDPTLLAEQDDASVNIRYGRIPQRVPRRYKTIKKVELFHGNFVLDSRVPSKLLDMCANRTEREYQFMRYSAATCDPNDFQDEGYTLRQVLYDPPRRTELFIVMTMYNEEEDLFCNTMHSVMKNIAHLVSRERSKTWGKDGWKKVVVCIVSDGRSKINSRTLSVIAAMGVYQDGIAKNAVNKKAVTAHIYEYTAQISVSPNMKIEGAERGIVPVQIIFCLKEKNQKKINSHRWFFNAFGKVLQPNVCILLDVGTRPGPTSIYHLWKAFDINSNVGGACGEIVADKGSWGLKLLNPLVAAQNFEYKMSNILDKPLESVFGYITVLPGAFSAYRYIALQNDQVGEGPLQKYFLGETMHGAGADIFTANMYLAEDRILCWELVSKRGGAWILHYVKSAYAVTDVPDQVPELISQRRRWLNGSFFAAIHSTVKFGYIYRSSHTFGRKFWIHIEMIYQVFNLIFSWFALGNYYIAFAILSKAMEDKSFGLNGIGTANIILSYFYLGLLVTCFLLALGNRPQGSKVFYTVSFVGFGAITIYMTFAAFFLAFKGVAAIQNDIGHGLGFADFFSNAIFRNIVVSLLATLGLYIIASLLFFEPWHMITSFVQYLLMAPSYINVLNVYAFANVHDVSWGTKGDNKVSTDLGAVVVGKNKNEVEVVVPTEEKDINAAYEDAIHVLSTKPPKVDKKRDAATKQEDYYKSFRTNVLLVWTLTNGLLAAAITTTTSDPQNGANGVVTGYMAFVLFSVAGLAAVRFVGSTAYMLIRLFAGE